MDVCVCMRTCTHMYLHGCKYLCVHVHHTCMLANQRHLLTVNPPFRWLNHRSLPSGFTQCCSVIWTVKSILSQNDFNVEHLFTSQRTFGHNNLNRERRFLHHRGHLVTDFNTEHFFKSQGTLGHNDFNREHFLHYREHLAIIPSTYNTFLCQREHLVTITSIHTFFHHKQYMVTMPSTHTDITENTLSQWRLQYTLFSSQTILGYNAFNAHQNHREHLVTMTSIRTFLKSQTNTLLHCLQHAPSFQTSENTWSRWLHTKPLFISQRTLGHNGFDTQQHRKHLVTIKLTEHIFMSHGTDGHNGINIEHSFMSQRTLDHNDWLTKPLPITENTSSCDQQNTIPHQKAHWHIHLKLTTAFTSKMRPGNLKTPDASVCKTSEKELEKKV